MKEFKVRLSATYYRGAAASQKRGVATLATALSGNNNTLKAYYYYKLCCLYALSNAIAKQVKSSNYALYMLTLIDQR